MSNWEEFSLGVHYRIIEDKENRCHGVSKIYPQSRLERHKHDADEYYVCMSDPFKVVINKATKVMYPGDLLYIPANVCHGIQLFTFDTKPIEFAFIFPNHSWEDVKYDMI